MNQKPKPDQPGSPATWIVVGAIVMVAAGMALFRLSAATSGLLFGGLLAVCLAMVGIVVWMDRRPVRRAKQSNHSESTRR